jgi:lambda repressor-like predicted transcriptional regulator
MTTTVRRERDCAERRDLELATSRVFASVFHAYMECSAPVQEAIRDMIDIVNDPESTPEETEAALVTIADALFPSWTNGDLGADLEECETGAPDDVRPKLAEADSQEALFADRVGELLKKTGMRQKDLADRIGVGQPAISMMLSRKCRPQRKTVEKIAEALGVLPSDIWPLHDGE